MFLVFLTHKVANPGIKRLPMPNPIIAALKLSNARVYAPKAALFHIVLLAKGKSTREPSTALKLEMSTARESTTP